MNAYKVIFEDGNSLVTSMNATLKEAKAYYIGKPFQLAHTDEKPADKMVKVVEVLPVRAFKFSFVGRLSGAQGKTYKISKTYRCFDQNEAFHQLYTEYELISTVCLNGELLSHR